jgi:citrate lyase subunit beta / citryl-CoA lyase
MRSLLMVSFGDDLDAALACGADGLVFSVDDGADSPGRARERLEHARMASVAIFVAVHALASGAVDADLDAIMPAQPDGILLPAAQGGIDLQHLSVKLAVREAELGFDEGSTKILAVAGATPAALFELQSFKGATARLSGLIFGQHELAEAMAIKAPSAALELARSLLIFAAKAAGVPAFDASAPGVDGQNFEELCRAAKRDGFAGKCAVDPGQIAPINAIFDAMP